MWKKIAVALLVVLLVIAGVMFYLWRQVTALPEWYDEEVAEVAAAAPGAIEAPGAVTPEGAPAWQVDPKSATGTRKVLRNFHRRALAKDPIVGKVIKASRASFEDGALEMGVVADLRNLPQDSLEAGQRDLFERVRVSFPAATEREVYIGVEDPSPALAGGKIELGSAAKLKIGSLTYDLDAAAARLGMSPAALRAQFNAQTASLGVTAP